MTPTADQQRIVDALRRAGFSGQALETVTAISLAETGGTASPGATNPGTPAVPEYSVGPLQINLNAHPTLTEAQARDPQAAADYAYRLSNGGQSFNPWTTFLDGSYRAWLATARQLIAGSTDAQATPQGAQGAQGGQQNVGLVPDIPGAIKGLTDAVAGPFKAVGDFFTAIVDNLARIGFTVLGVALVVGGGVLYFGGDSAVAAVKDAAREAPKAAAA